MYGCCLRTEVCARTDLTSEAKIGAAVLTARAALRTGTGKLSILTPQCGIEIIQNTIPEAMIELNSGVNAISGYYGFNYKTI